MLADMPISLRPYAKNITVIISAILTFLGLIWKGISALSNVDFLVQKLGFQENFANFLVSSKAPDLAIVTALFLLVVSLLFQYNRNQPEQIETQEKQLEEKPVTNLVIKDSIK